MALPTDVQTFTGPQLTAACVPGTGTASVPIATSADHTGATFFFYNNGQWRCRVQLANSNPATPLAADFKVTDIVAAGDTPVQMMQRLFAAAKIQLGLS